VITGRGFPSLEQFTKGIALPVGISFYTFEAVSYMVDVYRRDIEAERNPLRYAFFISFFPHLIAGPIVRYGQLGPQLRRFYRFDPDLMLSGLLLFSVGLVKKAVFADQIAARVDPLFASSGQVGFLPAWGAAFGFAFQAYFDFSGYSDMALGLARMMGIELPWNFDRPYRAANPQEIWRRWHVTLSTWLRDYLYIPLGGSRKGALRRDANLLTTMGVAGLWHGASWNFLVFGLWNGGLLAGHRRLGSLGLRLWRPVAVGITFVLWTIGLVIFRGRSADESLGVFAGMAGLHGGGGLPGELAAFLLVSAAIMWGTATEEWRWRFEDWARWRIVALGAATAVALVLVNQTHRFIYFKF
jgi:D-alanyl-lipoteichoic acid acyltransferase DltB (MBOAT superfamily)